MWPFSLPIDDLTAQDLEKLVQSRIRESHHLEYKRDEPWDVRGDTAKGSEKRSPQEMLKDVSGLANARGGYIIYGIEECDEGDDGTPSRLVGIDNGPEWQERVQNSCHDCIKPAIVGLHVRDIKLSDEKWALVVRVPASSNRPHLVQRKDSRKFWCRHERSVQPMSIEEIRASVLEAYNAEEYRTQFLARKKEEVLVFAEGMPTLYY